jgi:hypothetical protein
MDGDVAALRAELELAMGRVTQLKVALDRAEGKVPQRKVPHYSVIENAAHEVGQELSRRVQERMLNEVVAEQPSVAKCPACGMRCSLTTKRRTVLSGDGRISLQEQVGHCPVCRRDFFPAA